MMQRYFSKGFQTLILCFVVSLPAFSQENNTPEASSTPSEPFSFPSLSKGDLPDQVMIDLNYDGWHQQPDSVHVKGLSRGINIHVMFDKPLNKGQNISFAFGVGFSTQNIFTNADVVETTDSTGAKYAHLQPFAEGVDVKKNKLSTNYIEIPIEFRFRTNENQKGKRWKLALGAKGGYLFNIHTKTIMGNGDKFKGFNFSDVNSWRYGPVARIGYGSIGLTAFYALSPLFEKNRGVELFPFSFGFSFTPF